MSDTVELEAACNAVYEYVSDAIVDGEQIDFASMRSRWTDALADIVDLAIEDCRE